ncbi:MAG: hypothetical protein HQK88_00665 [Nitrospirae bacterium]|nr:hypothetical protein [Nitrospirota bacterium]MBF0535213.1 hypothetical protein [Nitrospirota bacterium]MBF0615307.1 hypothetical protein [Nitrospirota bacterium]
MAVDIATKAATDSTLIGFLTDKEFSIPLAQMLLFVIANSVCLLLGKFRLGLVVTYMFVFFWGYIYKREFLIATFEKTEWGVPLYAFFGTFILIMGTIGLLKKD